MTGTPLSAIQSGGTVNVSTDAIVAVRNGNTDVLVTLSSGSGTVTSASVVTANGFAGTVANATTTPAITLSTSITGVLKGNGTAISAATAGTDYQAPITLTTTGTSGAATFSGNTLNIPQYGDANLKLGEIGKGFDNGSSVINTGQSPGFLICPYAGTITGWTMIGNTTGSIVVNVWKVASGSIPTSANSIVASAPPTMTSAQQATSSTLTGWTTSVAVGDVFAFSVTSVSTLSHVDLVLLITKS